MEDSTGIQKMAGTVVRHELGIGDGPVDSDQQLHPIAGDLPDSLFLKREPSMTWLVGRPKKEEQDKPLGPREFAYARLCIEAYKARLADLRSRGFEWEGYGLNTMVVGPVTISPLGQGDTYTVRFRTAGMSPNNPLGVRSSNYTFNEAPTVDSDLVRRDDFLVGMKDGRLAFIDDDDVIKAQNSGDMQGWLARQGWQQIGIITPNLLDSHAGFLPDKSLPSTKE